MTSIRHNVSLIIGGGDAAIIATEAATATLPDSGSNRRRPSQTRISAYQFKPARCLCHGHNALLNPLRGKAIR